MKRFSILAGLAAVSLPAAALAAQISIEGHVSVGTGANAGAELDIGGAAGADDATNAAAAIAALPMTQAEVDAIADLQADSEVTVVLISTAANTVAEQIATARSDGGEDIARLHGAIEANADFRADLDASDIPIDSVLSADVEADGTLVLYATA